MSGFQSLVIILFWTLCAARGSAQEETAQDWNWHWTQGQSAMAAGQHAVAADHFRQVAALLRSEPSSRILLARCESRSGHHKAAVAALSEAVTLGWEDTDSLQQESDLAAIQTLPEFQAVVTAAGKNRSQRYLMYESPAARDAATPPLILLYHGRGELPHSQLHTWREAADKAGWLLLIPKGTRRLGPVYAWEVPTATGTWEVNRDEIVRQSREYLAEFRATRDFGPIVVAGFSQGSVAALSMLSDSSDDISGAVLFASAFPTAEQSDSFADAFQLTGRRVVMHVGTEDRWLKGNQFVQSRLASLGTPIRFQEWQDLAHDMPRESTAVILESVNFVLNGPQDSPRTARRPR